MYWKPNILFIGFSVPDKTTFRAYRIANTNNDKTRPNIRFKID